MSRDSFQLLNKMIPWSPARNRVLDMVLNIAIPFNRWLGMRVQKLSADEVNVTMPFRTLSKNHVGGVHACALALLGEYPAGLLITQNFSAQKYRLILKNLKADYLKQGRTKLTSKVMRPDHWPEEENGVMDIPMQTRIYNNKNEEIAVIETLWQLKRWDLVRKN